MTEDSPVHLLTQPAGVEPFRLGDGRIVLLRSVTPEDAPRLTSLCERLSAESSRLRFFRAGRRLSPKEALGLSDIDHVRNEAVVALDADRVIALGTLHQLGDYPQAELTLLVDDTYQGRGLGRHLLEILIEVARRRRYQSVLLELLPDNERMLGLLESTGLRSIADDYFGVLRVYVYLEGLTT